jgi:hypothetical protein
LFHSNYVQFYLRSFSAFSLVYLWLCYLCTFFYLSHSTFDHSMLMLMLINNKPSYTSYVNRDDYMSTIRWQHIYNFALLQYSFQQQKLRTWSGRIGDPSLFYNGGGLIICTKGYQTNLERETKCRLHIVRKTRNRLGRIWSLARDKEVTLWP